MSRADRLYLYTLIVLCLILPVPVQAGGPIDVSDSGVASAWDNTVPIPYNPEDGSCGPFSNTTMLEKLRLQLLVLSSSDNVDFSFEQVTESLGQVNGDNYTTFLFLDETSDDGLLTDGINPVVFDDDGDITAAIAGEGNRFAVLGLAAPIGFTADFDEIVAGQAIFNCVCLEDHPSGPCLSSGGSSLIEVKENELNFIIVHEMGHFLNLGHSQVNFDLFNNSNANDDKDVPIMFPFAFDAGDEITLRRDDVSSLAAIYPSSDFQTDWCVIQGTLLSSSGNALSCVDVWAEDGDASNTVGQVSGSLAIGTDKNADNDIVDSGEITSRGGFFEIIQLPGPADFTITLYPIDENYIGGSSVGPCLNEQLTSVTSEQVATVTQAQCTAGTTINLGDITSSIEGGSGGGGGGGGGGRPGIDSDLNPVGYLCSLVRRSSFVVRRSSTIWVYAGFALTLGVFLLLRRRTSLILKRSNISELE